MVSHFRCKRIKMLQLETTPIFHPNVYYRTDPTAIHSVKFLYILINFTKGGVVSAKE